MLPDSTIETLRVNMAHFTGGLRGEPLRECPDHSSYDTFLEFVASRVFCFSQEGRKLFVEDKKCRGLDAIMNILFDENVDQIGNNSCDLTAEDLDSMFEEEHEYTSNYSLDFHHHHGPDKNDLIYMRRAALHLLGMLLAEESFFKLYHDTVLNDAVLAILLDTPPQQAINGHRHKLRKIHEQDRALLIVSSLESLALMLHHGSVLNWLVNDKHLLDVILFRQLTEYGNTYVRKTASHLLVCLVKCQMQIGNVQDLLIHIDKDLITPLYDGHRLSFLDVCFCIVCDNDFPTHDFSDDKDNTINESNTKNNDRKSAIDIMIKQTRLVERVISSINSEQLIQERLDEDVENNKFTMTSSAVIRKRAVDILVILSKHKISFNHSVIIHQLLVRHMQENDKKWWHSNIIADIEVALNLLQSLDKNWMSSYGDINMNGIVINSLLSIWRSMILIVDSAANLDIITDLHVMKRGKLIEQIIKSLINIWPNTHRNQRPLTIIISYLNATVIEYRHSNDSICKNALLLMEVMLKQGDNSFLISESVVSSQLDIYLYRLFQSSNNTQLYDLSAKVLDKLTVRTDLPSPSYRDVITRRLYDINWEIRDTSLQLLKEDVTKFGFQDNDGVLLDLVLQRLEDSEPFVRLRAIEVIDSIVTKRGLHNTSSGKSPIDLLLLCTTSSVDFFVHEKVLHTLMKWMVAKMLTWEDFRSKAIPHLSQIARRAFDEFDYELMDHLLQLCCNAIIPEQVSKKDKLQVIVDMHMDCIIQDLIYGNVTVGKSYDSYLDCICDAFAKEANQLQGESHNQLLQVILKHQERKTNELSMKENKEDIKNFFTMSEENYDCY